MLKKLIAAVMALFAAAAFAAVDVNKADAAALDTVKGIGPGIAGKILDERKKGSFKDWNDLIARVGGIGDTNAAKLSEGGLTVNGSSFKGAAPAPAAKKDEKAAAPAAAAAKKDEKAAAPAAAAPKKEEKAAAPAAAADKKADPKADKAAEKKAAADKAAAEKAEKKAAADKAKAEKAEKAKADKEAKAAKKDDKAAKKDEKPAAKAADKPADAPKK